MARTSAGPVDFRSFRIVDGEVDEEEVTVVERYADDDSQTPTQTQKAAD